MSAAERLLKSFQGAWWPADRVEIERSRQALQAEIGKRYEQFTRKGADMTMEEAIAFAIQDG